MFDQPNPRLTATPHSFSKVPRADIPRSSFNRSHSYKTTLDAGYLYPVYIDEALPGDTFNLSMTTFARMATPIAPIMDNLYCDVFFFAVPYRLVWNNWEKFNGAQTDPGDSTDFLIPQVVAPVGGFGDGTIYDYFGLPTLYAGLSVSSLPFRGYSLIWNEWFRDQNLQDSLVFSKGDGPDSYADFGLRRRGKRHDYFTSCLPWPQKGTAVSLPLGTTAPVIADAQGYPILRSQNNDFTTALASTGGDPKAYWSAGNAISGQTMFWSDPNLMTDLSSATAATINQLREAFQMQKLFERDARGGTRYTEVILAHFGVQNPDFRLQRPEFLGGGSTPINMNAVPQTSSTDATTPQGNLAATATFSHTGVGFTKSFTEHCIIIGLASIRADMTYQQGLDRMWSRSTRYDFYWPALAHLGEQAVLNKELVYTGTSRDDEVFGYQERYAEYRYKQSKITGELRSGFGSLDHWHLAQEFGAGDYDLNENFIHENPPVDRVIAVPSAPQFIYDSVINLTCARPMPVYSVPGNIDRL